MNVRRVKGVEVEGVSGKRRVSNDLKATVTQIQSTPFGKREREGECVVEMCPSRSTKGRTRPYSFPSGLLLAYAVQDTGRTQVNLYYYHRTFNSESPYHNTRDTRGPKQFTNASF